MKPHELPGLGKHQLLDVRLADDYESAHLSEARNNCVFEVSFTDRLAESAPDPALTTVVYGAREGSHEAAAAAEKLRRNGYADVRILEGGLDAAEAAGLEIERGAALAPEPALPDGRWPIDLEESRLEWLGRNLLNKHWGTAAIESGHLVFQEGQLKSGEFVINLTRLDCTDLAGTDIHDLLIDHLQNDDFFDVENHPKATFRISGVEQDPEYLTGSRNLGITGDLTLRGETHPIQFQAAAGLTTEGKPAAQAAFSIDRTRWGILYGSDRFFSRLAGHVVNDMLEFQLRIVTE